VGSVSPRYTACLDARTAIGEHSRISAAQRRAGEEVAGDTDRDVGGAAEGFENFGREVGEGEVSAEGAGLHLDCFGHAVLVAGVMGLQGVGVVCGALKIGDVRAGAVVAVGGGEGGFVGEGADGGEEGLGRDVVGAAEFGDGEMAAGAADDFVTDGVAGWGAADEAGDELAVGFDAGGKVFDVRARDGSAVWREAALGGVDAGDVCGCVNHGGVLGGPGIGVGALVAWS